MSDLFLQNSASYPFLEVVETFEILRKAVDTIPKKLHIIIYIYQNI